MKKLVWGCFHWAGFHLIREWLELGETIIGIDTLDNEQKETLEMFIGRNDHFTRFDSIEEFLASDAGEEIDRVIVMGDHDLQPPYTILEQIPASAHYRIDLSKEEITRDSWITIDLPPIYGPWMLRDRKPITEGSVYITDVMPVITSILKGKWDQRVVHIGMEWDQERNDKNIIQTVPMKEGIKKLEEHRKRFSMYYS